MNEHFKKLMDIKAQHPPIPKATVEDRLAQLRALLSTKTVNIDEMLISKSHYAINPTMEFAKLALTSDDLILDLLKDRDNHRYFRLVSIPRLDFDEMYGFYPVVRHYGNEPIPHSAVTLAFCHWLYFEYPEFYSFPDDILAEIMAKDA